MYIIIKMSSKVETTSTTQSTEKKTKKVVSKATKPEETVSTTPVVTTTVEVSTPVVQEVVSTTTTVTPPAEETTQTTESDEVSKQLLEQFNDMSDKLTEFTKNMRNITFNNKDVRNKFETVFKKFFKASSQLTVTYPEIISKQLSIVEKSSHGKSSVKKTANKDKSAVNKKLVVEDNLLTFMGLDKGTMVSRAEALQAITGYVKSVKETGNPDIKVEGNNRAFKLIGKLQPLFKGIEKTMIERGDLKKGDIIPDKITYIQIMKYMTYCFKKNVVTVI
jgi:hypothetical protein